MDVYPIVLSHDPEAQMSFRWESTSDGTDLIVHVTHDAPVVTKEDQLAVLQAVAAGVQLSRG